MKIKRLLSVQDRANATIYEGVVEVAISLYECRGAIWDDVYRAATTICAVGLLCFAPITFPLIAWAMRREARREVDSYLGHGGDDE